MECKKVVAILDIRECCHLSALTREAETADLPLLQSHKIEISSAFLPNNNASREEAASTSNRTHPEYHVVLETNAKGPANGNRHGWLKQDGGNKKEGGQEWALSLLLVHAR
ncbi:hypothetical protein J6590_084506 [Homalodisca vitripennis]|nr:hypothetical protein J6590_084506 [Homalodisca vitripennis]